MKFKIDNVGQLIAIENFHGTLGELRGGTIGDIRKGLDAAEGVAPAVREQVRSELDKAEQAASTDSPESRKTAKTHLENAAAILKAAGGFAQAGLTLATTIGLIAAKIGLG